MTEATQIATKVLRNVLAHPTADYTTDQALDDLGLDSLDRVELVMEIETEMNTEFTDEEIESLSTFGDLVKMVESAGGGQ